MVDDLHADAVRQCEEPAGDRHLGAVSGQGAAFGAENRGDVLGDDDLAHGRFGGDRLSWREAGFGESGLIRVECLVSHLGGDIDEQQPSGSQAARSTAATVAS